MSMTQPLAEAIAMKTRRINPWKSELVGEFKHWITFIETGTQKRNLLVKMK
jgi:hypothetical protein